MIILAAEDTIRVTVDELLKVLSARNIMGDPIDTEDKTIIPITKMGMGFGVGMRSTNEASSPNGMTGSGGGAGVQPVAVVVIFKGVPGPEGVRVLPLEEPSAMAESLSQVMSLVIDKLSGHKGGRGASGQSTSIEVK